MCVYVLVFTGCPLIVRSQPLQARYSSRIAERGLIWSISVNAVRGWLICIIKNIISSLTCISSCS